MVEPLMLGLTTYQEALRALGPLVDPAGDVRIVELAHNACVEVTTPRGIRQIGIAQLEEIVLNSHARRGVADNGPGASQSDVLRSVGLALDELRARNVCGRSTAKWLTAPSPVDSSLTLPVTCRRPPPCRGSGGSLAT